MSALFVFGLVAGRASAQGAIPGEGTITVAPADGKPRGVRLRAQTVHTVISEDEAGVWADTMLEVQLQNRGKAPIVLPIGIPGPQIPAYVTPTLALPPMREAWADKKPLIFTPGGQAPDAAIQASAVITIPVDSTVTVRLRYRQAVPVRDDLAAYAYPLQAGAIWAGAPESLSLVLTFQLPVSAEQIMQMTPGAATPQPGVYRWGWNGREAPTNVTAVFVTHRGWRDLASARTAAAMPGAGLAEHVALAEHYWKRATLAPPAFAPQASFYQGAVPLAVAAWRAGIASAGPGASAEDLARAHERLAGIYLAEASRSERDAAQTYLQLAVEEVAQAVALRPGDRELATWASALQERLAVAAASRGDGAAAAAHAARLEALAAGQAAPAPEAVQRRNALSQAEAAVASGDLADARRLLEAGYGSDILALPDARPPLVTQALLRVESRATGRTIALRLVDRDEGRSAAALIRETAGALREIAPVTPLGSSLLVTLAYTDPAALAGAQSRLAAALPRKPELALLSAALTGPHVAWPEQTGWLGRTARYEERVDLRNSLAAWQAEAARLEAAADRAAAAGGRLDLVRAAVWRADGRLWRDLAALSRATYHVELQEQGAGPAWLQARVHQFYREGAVQREWVVRAGEARPLEASVLGWRYDRVALVVGAALLAAGLVIALVWLIAR